MVAIGSTKLSAISKCSAALIISSSIPDDANKRSTTNHKEPSRSEAKRTVASLAAASCSTIARTL